MIYNLTESLKEYLNNILEYPTHTAATEESTEARLRLYDYADGTSFQSPPAPGDPRYPLLGPKVDLRPEEKNLVYTSVDIHEEELLTLAEKVEALEEELGRGYFEFKTPEGYHGFCDKMERVFHKEVEAYNEKVVPEKKLAFPQNFKLRPLILATLHALHTREIDKEDIIGEFNLKFLTHYKLSKEKVTVDSVESLKDYPDLTDENTLRKSPVTANVIRINPDSPLKFESYHENMATLSVELDGEKKYISVHMPEYTKLRAGTRVATPLYLVGKNVEFSATFVRKIPNVIPEEFLKDEFKGVPDKEKTTFALLSKLNPLGDGSYPTPMIVTSLKNLAVDVFRKNGRHYKRAPFRLDEPGQRLEELQKGYLSVFDTISEGDSVEKQREIGAVLLGRVAEEYKNRDVTTLEEELEEEGALVDPGTSYPSKIVDVKELLFTIPVSENLVSDVEATLPDGSTLTFDPLKGTSDKYTLIVPSDVKGSDIKYKFTRKAGDKHVEETGKPNEVREVQRFTVNSRDNTVEEFLKDPSKEKSAVMSELLPDFTRAMDKFFKDLDKFNLKKEDSENSAVNIAGRVIARTILQVMFYGYEESDFSRTNKKRITNEDLASAIEHLKEEIFERSSIASLTNEGDSPDPEKAKARFMQLAEAKILSDPSKLLKSLGAKFSTNLVSRVASRYLNLLLNSRDPLRLATKAGKLISTQDLKLLAELIEKEADIDPKDVTDSTVLDTSFLERGELRIVAPGKELKDARKAGINEARRNIARIVKVVQLLLLNAFRAYPGSYKNIKDYLLSSWEEESVFLPIRRNMEKGKIRSSLLMAEKTKGSKSRSDTMYSDILSLKINPNDYRKHILSSIKSEYEKDPMSEKSRAVLSEVPAEVNNNFKRWIAVRFKKEDLPNEKTKVSIKVIYTARKETKTTEEEVELSVSSKETQYYISLAKPVESLSSISVSTGKETLDSEHALGVPPIHIVNGNLSRDLTSEAPDPVEEDLKNYVQGLEESLGRAYIDVLLRTYKEKYRETSDYLNSVNELKRLEERHSKVLSESLKEKIVLEMSDLREYIENPIASLMKKESYLKNQLDLVAKELKRLDEPVRETENEVEDDLWDESELEEYQTSLTERLYEIKAKRERLKSSLLGSFPSLEELQDRISAALITEEGAVSKRQGVSSLLSEYLTDEKLVEEIQTSVTAICIEALSEEKGAVEIASFLEGRILTPEERRKKEKGSSQIPEDRAESSGEEADEDRATVPESSGEETAETSTNYLDQDLGIDLFDFGDEDLD